MRSLTPFAGLLRNFAMVALLVAVAACSRTPVTGVGNLGPNGGPPGSQQEFLVTVGDRVFFDTDSSSLTPTATATLDKQAAWLNRYSKYWQDQFGTLALYLDHVGRKKAKKRKEIEP